MDVAVKFLDAHPDWFPVLGKSTAEITGLACIDPYEGGAVTAMGESNTAIGQLNSMNDIDQMLIEARRRGLDLSKGSPIERLTLAELRRLLFGLEY